MFLLTLAASLLGISLACPGRHGAVTGIPYPPKGQSTTEPELLGDLKTLPDSALSPTGWAIKNILLHNLTTALPTDDATLYTAPGPLSSPACRADTCCVFKHAADAMAALFRPDSPSPSPNSNTSTTSPGPGPGPGPCTELARQAVRFGFHDAGTWSKTASHHHGGADGSIMLAGEHHRRENLGLAEITHQMRAWHATFGGCHGAGMADLIQLGATVAAVSCPLGPRVRSFVGRRDSALAEPAGRLPGEADGAAALVAAFADKTFGVRDLVALVGAHSTSTQRFVDPQRAGAPQDTTPGVWDVSWYGETLAPAPEAGVLRFRSDLALARDPATSRFFREFAAPGGAWGTGYAAAYVRMSLLGVEHINDLEECTGVLPLRITEAQWSSQDRGEPGLV